MSRFVVGSGSVRIEVEDGIRDALEAAIREAAPRTIAALERELDAIIAAARADWPVGRRGPTDDRPHSRDLFELTFKVSPNLDVEATIYNKAGDAKGNDYAYKIKRKGDGLNVWQAFVVKKVAEAEQRLADILAEEMAAAVSQSGGGLGFGR